MEKAKVIALHPVDTTNIDTFLGNLSSTFEFFFFLVGRKQRTDQPAKWPIHAGSISGIISEQQSWACAHTCTHTHARTQAPILLFLYGFTSRSASAVQRVLRQHQPKYTYSICSAWGDKYPPSAGLSTYPQGKKEREGLGYSKDECALQLLGTQHKTSEREHRHHLMRHSKCLQGTELPRGKWQIYVVGGTEWFCWLP